jgi:hypothetical protein
MQDRVLDEDQRPGHQGRAWRVAVINFNDSDWIRNEEDVRWKYGIPPKGNANYAWVQHFIHHLSPTGFAGFVLANGSMSSTVLAPLHSPPDDLVYPLSVVMPLRLDVRCHVPAQHDRLHEPVAAAQRRGPSGHSD